ncbi:MAG: NAD-dependent epimerase [Janthinobacterium lividum]
MLVTGAAGFIGFHLATRLLAEGDRVTGVDNLNDYYDVDLKRARLELLRAHPNFTFEQIDLSDKPSIDALFDREPFDLVVNLAAQAGVRYSLVNPHAYINSNISGFVNVLEACRHTRVGHLLYASSSSVYGALTAMPFSVRQNVDHPVSLYAASKKANELIAHTYSHLFRLPTTGVRFFTVYGPWGRPDMALFLFTRAILAGQPIDVFNNGQMERDFTYIDDIVEGLVRLGRQPATPDLGWDSAHPTPNTSNAPYRIYNIGNHQPVRLLKMIEILEDCLGRKAEKRFLPMQPGDVPATYADIDDLKRDVGFEPAISIEVGVERFVRWYRSHYSA